MEGIAPWQRVLMIAAVAVACHLLVVACRRLSYRFVYASGHQERRKLRSVVSLLTSSAVFTLYFIAAGFILGELGISITAYFASATIIGLAVGFDSQGLVQDVVSGLTTIFSDLFDVGDLVEIGGQSGIVRSMGLRFVELENSMGATVHLPNRSITNVIRYPRGYVRCIVDITMDEDAERRAEMVDIATAMARVRSVPGHSAHAAVHRRGVRNRPRQALPAREIPHLAQPRSTHRRDLPPGAGAAPEGTGPQLRSLDGCRVLRGGAEEGAKWAAVTAKGRPCPNASRPAG